MSIEPGDVIEHPTYGTGTVLEVQRYYLCVRFDNTHNGRRWVDRDEVIA